MEVVFNNHLSRLQPETQWNHIDQSELMAQEDSGRAQSSEKNNKKSQQHRHKHSGGRVIGEWCVLPAKPVGHDSHTEGSHHPANAKDGHGDTPDDGANSLADWLSVSLHPGVVEERSQFLRSWTEKQSKFTPVNVRFTSLYSPAHYDWHKNNCHYLLFRKLLFNICSFVSNTSSI